MSFSFNICIYTCLTVVLNVHGGNIDPFMDSQLFMINWAGPLDIIKVNNNNVKSNYVIRQLELLS